MTSTHLISSTLGAFVLFLVILGACGEDTAAPRSDRRADAGADMVVITDAGRLLGLGEPCEMTAGCQPGLTCASAGKAGEVKVCYYECTEAGRICAQNGAVCLNSSDNTPVCYTGGQAALNASCNDSVDCAVGLTCVNLQAGKSCQPACHREDPDCDTGSCNIPKNGGGRGWCA